jgi:hypothetical protein
MSCCNRRWLQMWEGQLTERQGLDQILAKREFAWLLCSIWLVTSSGARACACSQVFPGTCPGLQKGTAVFLGTLTDSFGSPSPAGAPAETTHPSASTENSNAEAQQSNVAAASAAFLRSTK